MEKCNSLIEKMMNAIGEENQAKFGSRNVSVSLENFYIGRLTLIELVDIYEELYVGPINC